MKRMWILILTAALLTGCDGQDAPTAPPAPAAPAATVKPTAAKASAFIDPMAAAARKGLYSQTDPMVALRQWDRATGAGAAAKSGPVSLDDMPEGEGRAMTFGFCGACHSIQLVVQQRLPAARWDELWTWMIETQGMPDPGPEVKQQILRYLKQHYAS